jgi:acetyl esterase/lipase
LQLLRREVLVETTEQNMGAAMPSQVDDNGTAHIGTNIVPVPRTVSAEAQEFLARPPASLQGSSEPIWTRRPALEEGVRLANKTVLERYPVHFDQCKMDGVNVWRLRSKQQVHPEGNGEVLISLHGGGFVVGTGSLVEAAPVCNLTGIPVVAVDYSLAPEHAFPAVEDVWRTYKSLRRTRPASKIGIFGTSAGATIAAQFIARLDAQEGERPACLGFFSGRSDLADSGDTARIFTPTGFWGKTLPPETDQASYVRAYLGDASPEDPLVSPLRYDLRRFPPSLLISGTRDLLLSSTALFHRALRRDHRLSELLVFEAMPHAHWLTVTLPESTEAFCAMSDFFARTLECD